MPGAFQEILVSPDRQLQNVKLAHDKVQPGFFMTANLFAGKMVNADPGGADESGAQ
jgi:hypothetical protein